MQHRTFLLGLKTNSDTERRYYCLVLPAFQSSVWRARRAIFYDLSVSVAFLGFRHEIDGVLPDHLIPTLLSSASQTILDHQGLLEIDGALAEVLSKVTREGSEYVLISHSGVAFQTTLGTTREIPWEVLAETEWE